ncbi:uncharacterized protein AMSG_05591 [Thecamonas trahens ATCC 50062]|uniref:Uncharacterized protein n=1 Tax=Thecamonas trahens ATCC 50062 TaxID=461836 RepID=A0A0L0DBD1_THETB|nr:hypothetical protein AMSG_05591 [Thecamonas trahens ATCC 50062]KNC49555.1 hypothetical protein AMSG_05591 [Thecamonas trahens ATCC 50062]|eukprot:XP_013757664.1 hypothetical protein AMSG_05591 [Thecamonas trahens ATCC 50062]
MFRSSALRMGAAAARSITMMNKPTNFKGKFAKRKPGLSTRKGRAPKPSLTAKKGPVGYYKGSGVGAKGTRSARGVFVRDPAKIPTILRPAASLATKFKPYVAVDAPKMTTAPPTAHDFIEEALLQPIWEDADIKAQLAELEAMGVDVAAVGLTPESSDGKFDAWMR